MNNQSIKNPISDVKFSIGFVKSNEKVEIRYFNTEGITQNKSLDILDLEKNLPQFLLYNSNEVNLADLLSSTPYLSFVPRKDICNQLDHQSFMNLSTESLISLSSQISKSWSLFQNINLVEKLFSNIDHLISLWPNSRSQFFEEFWFLLKSNMETKNLSIIYNDKVEQGEKSKLIPVLMTGSSSPSIKDDDQFAKSLLDNYHHSFSEQIEIMEWSEETGNFLATFKIRGSSIILMANLFEISALTKSTLTALVDGLNKNISSIH